MKSKQQFIVSRIPAWTKAIPTKDIISFVKSAPSMVGTAHEGNGICHIYDHKVRTSNTSNETYVLRVWDITNSDLLQSATIQEFALRSGDVFKVYRAGVIKNGAYVDLTDDLNVRIMDDERSSQFGSFVKSTKANCVINGISVNDAFVFEYSIENVFDKKQFLDKKYFRYFCELPVGYWLYRTYDFTLLQERAERVCAAEKYFADEQKQRVADKMFFVDKGQTYSFHRDNLNIEDDPNCFNPYIEIATQSSWPEIATAIHEMSKKELDDTDLRKSELYASLDLGNTHTQLLDKVMKVSDYVQEEVVYLYDADVMHGHIPQACDVTISQKAGDCKAKSLLLVGLLRSIGVTAEVLCVNYDSDYFIPGYLPSPFVFNHAIVRYVIDDVEYFIDPTWRGNKGYPGFRSEPRFSHYLQFVPGAMLSIKAMRKVYDVPNIEEKVEIKLSRKSAGKISIDCIFRWESADIMRDYSITRSKSQFIETQNSFILSRLALEEKVDAKTFFQNTTFDIVKDDVGKNELIMKYTTDFQSSYQPVNNFTVFRFYYPFTNAERLIAHKHRDLQASSFVLYPVKYSVHIMSDLFVQRQNKTTKKTFLFDNEYFYFQNKKRIGSKELYCDLEYKPKLYGYVKNDDLPKLVSEYQQMTESAFGIGAVFLGVKDLLKQYRWAIALFIWVILSIFVR